MSDSDSDTYVSDELETVYECLVDASEGTKTERECATIGMLFVMTDYARDIALQREHKLVESVSDKTIEKPDDPGTWEEYVEQHDDFEMLVEWTDPEKGNVPIQE